MDLQEDICWAVLWVHPSNPWPSVMLSSFSSTHQAFNWCLPWCRKSILKENIHIGASTRSLSTWWACGVHKKENIYWEQKKEKEDNIYLENPPEGNNPNTSYLGSGLEILLRHLFIHCKIKPLQILSYHLYPSNLRFTSLLVSFNHMCIPLLTGLPLIYVLYDQTIPTS